MCDFITEDSVLQDLESQFELLFIARSQRGWCTSFLGITAELLMETRCQGRDLAGRGSQALVVAASRAAFHAHSKGLCLIDTLAASARCLGEAGLLTGDLQVHGHQMSHHPVQWGVLFPVMSLVPLSSPHLFRDY